jgi:endonuclease YncB( thermonuclease family)
MMKDHNDMKVDIVYVIVAILLIVLIFRLREAAVQVSLQATAPTVPVKSWDATVVSNHDGDTVTIMVDHEWGIYSERQIRIYGINAPELVDPAGKVARDYMAQLLPTGTKVLFTPKREKNGLMTLSFARYVGMIERKGADGLQDVAPLMIGQNMAQWTDENGRPANKPPKPIK